VVLALGVLRLPLVVLHAPMPGYANQYDMLRSSACVGLWPDVAPAERVLATPQAPLPDYRYGHPASGLPAVDDRGIARRGAAGRSCRRGGRRQRCA
jgi:hypothetical protein